MIPWAQAQADAIRLGQTEHIPNFQVVHEAMSRAVSSAINSKKAPEVAAKEAALKEFLSRRRYPFHDPLYTFIFLPNDFLPEVRINRQGVVDIKKNEVLWPARKLTTR